MVVISSDWMLDSISNYKLLPVGKYRVTLPPPPAVAAAAVAVGEDEEEEVVVVG
jgi:hypothetical protein